MPSRQAVWLRDSPDGPRGLPSTEGVETPKTSANRDRVQLCLQRGEEGRRGGFNLAKKVLLSRPPGRKGEGLRGRGAVTVDAEGRGGRQSEFKVLCSKAKGFLPLVCNQFFPSDFLKNPLHNSGTH